MRAAWAWARAQLRHRLVMLLAVGVLAGVAGAATLAAVAGVRRTATVFDRHHEQVNGAHVSVGPDFDPQYFVPGVLDPYYEIEGVEDYSEVLLLAMRPVGSDFLFLFDRTVVGAVDDRLGTELDRPRIVEGRVFDHGRDDEVALSEEYADAVGVGVGDVIRFESWSKAAVAAAFENNFRIGPPDGPVVAVTVVGIFREVEALVSRQVVPGTAVLPAAFTRRWGPEIGVGYLGGAVRLKAGDAGFESYRDAAALVSEKVGLGLRVERLTGDAAQVSGAIDAQVLALWVFAAVTAAAGAVVVWAALSRQLSFASSDQMTLSAIGLTRPERGLAVVLVGVPVALVAAVVSVGLALGASGLLPIATPGRLEPDPGLRADVWVLSAGGAAVAMTVVVSTAAAGVSVTRIAPTAPVGWARAGVGMALAGCFGGSPPGSIGVRHALDGRCGPQAVPTRSTLVGCAVGVTGVVAALSFAASLAHLTNTPRLYGWAADAGFWPDGGHDAWQEVAGRLEADPDIAELATVIATELVVDGQTTPTVVLELRRGDPFNVITSGRAPRARDEIAVGANPADALAVGLGDRVSVATADGSLSPHTVVGTAVHPNDFDGYRSQITVLGDSTEPFLVGDEGPGYGVLVRFADGVDPAVVIDRYRAEGIDAVVGGMPPRAVTNLDEVHLFPLVLAALLGMLATVFLLHALTLSARRRGLELAVLATLGFTRRQLRMIVLWQATTIAVVALAVGVPLGVGIGRIAWATLAENLAVVTEHRLSAWWVLWVVGVIGLALVLGLVASRRVTRLRPAAELRAAMLE
ncbi:MAG TPA: FtsX-like permease family protein [Acidimicrobiales bacterium]|nr:FtsX-like permease family protein [Acidimicrobiales bacterium]